MRDSLRRSTLTALGAGAAKVAGNGRVQTLLFNGVRLNRPELVRLRDDPAVLFASYCFAMRHRSRSQILQDLWVCFELGDKRHGFFVEFGATNGLTNSNTWLLEHELGWTGVLAEPNPFWHDELAANRSVPIDHRCVSSSTGESIAFIATDNTDPELSGIADYSQGEHFADARSAGTRLEVETVSLTDLLGDHGAPSEIDYLSIDTEGNELEVLRTFDFARHRPTLMSVEHNMHTEASIDGLLAAQGYLRVFPQFSQWDGWYVLGEHREREREIIHAPRA